MSVKLTDTQLAMLSAAAQREDVCLTAPDRVKGANYRQSYEKPVMIKRRFFIGPRDLAERHFWLPP